jgi:hypothetical protein
MMFAVRTRRTTSRSVDWKMVASSVCAVWLIAAAGRR